MSEVIVVTEEQAVQFEKAGIAVKVQYTVALDELSKLKAPTKAAPKRERERVHKVVGNKAKLRWTNLRYTGNADTQVARGYDLLSEYFGRHPEHTPVRQVINTYLTKELLKKGEVFNSSIVHHLIKNKYLEVCDA